MHITAALFSGVESSRESSPSGGTKPLDNAAIVAGMHTDPRKLTWVDKRNG